MSDKLHWWAWTDTIHDFTYAHDIPVNKVYFEALVRDGAYIIERTDAYTTQGGGRRVTARLRGTDTDHPSVPIRIGAEK